MNARVPTGGLQIHKSHRRLMQHVYWLWLLSCILVVPASAGILSVKILDEQDLPVPARVYLKDQFNRSYSPSSATAYHKERDGIIEQHFVPPKGAFEIDLPAGDYQIEIERGKEYLPVQEKLKMTAAGRLQKTFRLKRWIGMSSLGWFSGDMHWHRPLRDTAALMEAEDLNIALPISRWRAQARDPIEDPDLKSFLDKADGAGFIRVGRDRWFAVLNEELEPRASALLTFRLGKERTMLRYPLARYGQRARDRGALVDSEKGTSLELPVIAALEGCNFVGLANNHHWRSGCFAGPWGAWPDHMLRRYPADCAGFSLAGAELYYALLNMGFPLKLSAGSASGVHPVPPGWSRVYVNVQGAFTPDRWLTALQKGKSFVTTGPMILLKIGELGPGEEAEPAKFPFDVQVEVRMLSPQAVRSAEIVVNGKLHPLMLSPEPGKRFSYRGRMKLTLRTGSWVAARWLSKSGNGIAHTSPIYFRNHENPIPVPHAEAEYLLQRVEKLIELVSTGKSEDGSPQTSIVCDTPALKEETLRGLQQAKDVYRSKLQQSQ